MKPLILILLAAVSVEAQSIVEVARQERARQAQVQSRRVFTSENTRGTAVATPAKPATPAATQPAPTPNAAAPTTPAVDLAKKFADDVALLRTRIRGLQDQDAAIQLQINDLNTKFFAPVSDQASKEQAQAQLAVAQQQSITVRQELALARAQLQQMEAQGPPAAR
jgi:hypothetical protein